MIKNNIDFPTKLTMNCKGFEPGEIVDLASQTIVTPCTCREVTIPRFICEGELNPNVGAVYEPDSFKRAMDICLQGKKLITSSLTKNYVLGYLKWYTEDSITMSVIDEDAFNAIESPVVLLDTWVEELEPGVVKVCNITDIHIQDLKYMSLDDQKLYEDRLKARCKGDEK